MARTVRSTKLETRNGRLQLPQSHEPYWKQISKGLHVGYYKGGKSASWRARYRSETQAKYITATLGLADDIMDADGVKVLTFDQAQEKARCWYKEQIQIETGNRVSSKKYTVKDALNDYLAWFKSSRRTVFDTDRTITSLIVPALGNIELKKLTTKQILEWRTKLVETPARVRSKKSGTQAYKAPSKSAESYRKRQASANRVVTILKAALSYAYRESYVSSDEAWKRVKPFHNVDSPSKVFLTEDECKRLTNACDVDFRQVVWGAILTGCRYSELARLICGDFDYNTGSCLIRESKNGKPRRVTLSSEGKEFFADLTAGNPASKNIFLREDGSKWGKSNQSRRFSEALEHSKIDKEISFHGLRDTHASQLVERGVPMAVIAAQLGHSDTRICEKHYAHLRPSYISDTIRNNLPTFFDTRASKIARIDGTTAKKKGRR